MVNEVEPDEDDGLAQRPAIFSPAEGNSTASLTTVHRCRLPPD